jgi:hypothetical protein
MPHKINKSTNRSVCVRVCIRDGWSLNGIAAQHKYFWWEDGSFTGMGSASREPAPDVENGPAGERNLVWTEVEHVEYWVTPAHETQMKNLAGQKKVQADNWLWVPYANDCHTLVDDVLRELHYPPTVGLGRFAGNSSTLVSRSLQRAKTEASKNCLVM